MAETDGTGHISPLTTPAGLHTLSHNRNVSSLPNRPAFPDLPRNAVWRALVKPQPFFDYGPARSDPTSTADATAWRRIEKLLRPRTQLSSMRTFLPHSHRHLHDHSHPQAHSHSHSHVDNEVGDTSSVDDVEKGAPDYQRFVLNIDGLKCGCCETGITRTMDRIAAIRSYQLNIVTARLEFELDINRSPIDNVIKKLGTATGYSFEQNSRPRDQVLELANGKPQEFRYDSLPDGVTAIEFPDRYRQFRDLSWFWTKSSLALDDDGNGRLEKLTTRFHAGQHTAGTQKPQLVRIHYDTKVIGARDLFTFYHQRNHELMVAPPAAHSSLSLSAKRTRRAFYWFLPALILTIPVLVLAWAPVNHEKLEYAHVSIALASVIQLIACAEFLPGALRSLRYSRVLDMDFLILLSTTTAFIFSAVLYARQVAKKPLETDSFFETSTLLVTLILLGRVINEFARYRAAKAVSFRSLQIDKAVLVETGQERRPNPPTTEIDARLLQYGDNFKVSPHTRVVTDGVVYYGGSEVDESMLTGESVPVAKGVHSHVYAGTMNGNGTLFVALKALPHENTVHKIAAMVECAELTQPKVQALADRVAVWFVPFIAAVGSFVFLTWLLIDRYHKKRDWSAAVTRAITYAIATLVVSCPCAIGLAVPMVVLIAGGVAARYSIIFKDPQKLEVARNITDVVFDKTGTLTTSYFSVISEQYCGSIPPKQIKRILLGLLKDNKHPISLGVYNHLAKQSRMSAEPDLIPVDMYDIRIIPGEGIMGSIRVDGCEVWAGNPTWLTVNVEETDCSHLCVRVYDQTSAIFKLRDMAKCNAGRVIEALQRRCITVHMISGDSQGAVNAVAHQLNIPKRYTKWSCRPEGKRKYIQDLQDRELKGRNRVILFVGDGTNDSVALKQADVGAHMQCSQSSSDLAKQAADVVFMTDRLADILVMLDISKGAYRRIVTNFVWSAAYNVAAILFAAGAFAGIKKAGHEVKIPPEWAGLGELVSVLPVVAIAFQMRWRNYGKRFKDIDCIETESEDTRGRETTRT